MYSDKGRLRKNTMGKVPYMFALMTEFYEEIEAEALP